MSWKVGTPHDQSFIMWSVGGECSLHLEWTGSQVVLLKVAPNLKDTVMSWFDHGLHEYNNGMPRTTYTNDELFILRLHNSFRKQFPHIRIEGKY
jgi:hypothetical protein